MNKRTTILATLTLALTLGTLGCSKKHHATPGKLTKDDLVDTAKMVIDAHPAPYKETFDKVVAELGAPMKAENNLQSWFAKDGDKCMQLFVTESEHSAAANVMEADAANCK